MKQPFVLSVMLFLASISPAQQTPTVEVFGGYSYLNFDVPSTALTQSTRLNTHGWEASGSVSLFKRLSAEANFSGHYKGNCGDVAGLSCSSYSFLFGPKVSLGNGQSRWSGFVHGLVGVDKASAGVFGLSVSNNSLAVAAGGGVDYWVSRRIGIRVGQVDYFLTRHLHDLDVPLQNNFRASAGIVFRFGGEETVAPGLPSPTGRPTRVPRSGMQLPALGLAAASREAGGAVIIEVVPGSAAEMAGLRVGDVINAVDGKPVRTPMELAAELANHAPGSTVRLGVLVRGYWQSETTVILGGQH